MIITIYEDASVSAYILNNICELDAFRDDLGEGIYNSIKDDIKIIYNSIYGVKMKDNISCIYSVVNYYLDRDAQTITRSIETRFLGPSGFIEHVISNREFSYIYGGLKM